MECLGRFVGIGETVGHAMTFRILTEEGKVINRAVTRSAVKGGMFDTRRAEEAAPTLAPKDEVIKLKDKPTIVTSCKRP